MKIYLLYTITGVLGLLILFIMIIKRNQFNRTNQFLGIIIGIVSIRFLLYGLIPFFPEIPIKSISYYFNLVSFGINLPISYLYFYELILNERIDKKKLLHLFFPVALAINLIIYAMLQEKYESVFKIVVIIIVTISYILYLSLIFILIKKYVWFKKSDFKSIDIQNKLIRNWILFFYSIFILFFFRVYYDLFKYDLFYFIDRITEAKFVTAIFWQIIFFKLLITPEILYGYQIITQKIEEAISNNIILTEIWSKDILQEITSERDKKLFEKISTSVGSYIHKVEETSFHTQLFRKQDLGIEDLSLETGIPTSHLLYIFKYHSKETFIDYKKIVRIQDAIHEIKNGYLKTSTIESLAIEVGFNSYSPFFNSFKSIIGLSPLEYISKNK